MGFGMNKRDFFAICLLLAVCALTFSLLNNNHAKGKTAAVYIDGKLYAEYPLDQNTEEKINCGNGYNTIVIEDSQVYITDADCPDKYCVSQGKIGDSGNSLVCLPHRLVVEISPGSAEQKIDAVAK